jgi:DNA-binding NarL/FixJ family response regulator
MTGRQVRLMQNMKMVRCVVCDDHEVVRLGLVRAMNDTDTLEVVGEAADGGAALEMIVRRRPDVAIVDLHMPGLNGIEIAQAVADACLSTAVIVFTADADPVAVRGAMGAGARGFILKRGPLQEIARAVEVVAQGQLYVDPTLVGALLDQSSDEPDSLLTRRETEVLQLLADGLTTQDTAATLFLAPATVRSYIENAMQKLGTHSRTAAVATAMRGGLIT